MTKPEALALIDAMATEIATYRGRLESWAYSPDAADRWHAQALRDSMGKIAKGLAAGGASGVDVNEVHCAMVVACAGDEYATAEIAGRFLSAHRRSVLVGRIRRHPKGHQFQTLVAALERGRPTKAQFDLASKLAGEVAA